MKFKYVVFKNSGMILWPYSDFIYHSHIAAAARQGDADNIPISAGFATITADDCNCYGESVSLRLKSRPEIDTRILKDMLSR